MWELMPLVAGAALGLLAGAPGRASAVRLGCGALVIGFMVALASGELAESWAFVLIDAGIALLGAFAARAMVLTARRRSSA